VHQWEGVIKVKPTEKETVLEEYKPTQLAAKEPAKQEKRPISPPKKQKQTVVS
jgi:hypothetical protein